MTDSPATADSTPTPRRGELRVYLGAAPGVGKTYAMLDEAWRRHQRGTDVVVGVVETHGRAATLAQLRDLPVIPRAKITYRGATLEEMDLDAVLARRPAVAVVDELAHTNAPGSRHAKRWEDVEELLAAGINVITTVNVQHLESLNDVVEKITGVVQRETVPDEFVRRASQIELVDMSPEALRRRMAHGNVYPADRIDAALANYFRAGNLGALRELALLWVADRVEDGLDDYRLRHRITTTWETRERVVVAMTGVAGGEALIRRAARIAARSRGELIGVHVIASDGLRRSRRIDHLDAHRELLIELGGRYHDVAGDDIGRTLVGFAAGQQATQIVLGASATTRLGSLLRGSVIGDVIRAASGIDVHVIATSDERRLTMLPRSPRFGFGLPRRRVLTGWGIVGVGLPLLTVILANARDSLPLASALLLYLGLVVAASAIGGVLPGIAGALGTSLLANYYLVPPLRTLTINQAPNALALAVFVSVAATVSFYVNLAARRTLDARRAQVEAEALARTTATLVGSEDPLPQLLGQLRSTFGLDGLAVLQRAGTGWRSIAGAGDAPAQPGGGRTLPLEAPGDDDETLLVFNGPPLGGEDERILRSHANQLVLALRNHAARQEADRIEVLEEIDSLRTAMLHAVSHDLRTPLTGIKAAITSLLADDVRWSEADTTEFLHTIDAESDRLTRLVENLLDMSRLQAGALNVQIAALDVADLIAGALGSISAVPSTLHVELHDELPAVFADPTLVERALANVITNAIAWSPVGAPIRVQADQFAGTVTIRVIDRGPGIAESLRDRVLQPFQQLDDRPTTSGVGLGLAVASGFIRAMHGQLILDDTPGGGLTVEIRFPLPAPRAGEELPLQSEVTENGGG